MIVYLKNIIVKNKRCIQKNALINYIMQHAFENNFKKPGQYQINAKNYQNIIESLEENNSCTQN